MDKMNRTRELLAEHLRAYPRLEEQDIFKYLFQSAFGCEHLVANESAVLKRIKDEYADVSAQMPPLSEPLDGQYSRVHLSHLSGGLSPETLATLFCLSAKKEPDGVCLLEQKLKVAAQLIDDGVLPFDAAHFAQSVEKWKQNGYCAVRHSDVFRDEYRPAYRVISNRYTPFLQVFAQIDKLLANGRAVVAIEGGSASGKSTLSEVLQSVYGCNVFHMDDFFLRPEQRTRERLGQIGGNVDRERFAEEVLVGITRGEAVSYRRYDCGSQSLGESVLVKPDRLTVVEGVYSMHPELGKYYDLAVFLNVSPDTQRARIGKRNTPALAQRFFGEWIPMENAYFVKMGIRERCDVVIDVK